MTPNHNPSTTLLDSGVWDVSPEMLCLVLSIELKQLHAATMASLRLLLMSLPLGIWLSYLNAPDQHIVEMPAFHTLADDNYRT